MSAVKIIFKRSSILGKRPTGANLEAGEIGLNTNSNDPGLFFEVNDGSVVKAGPTAYLTEPPTSTPALGELWVDRDTKTLNIGNENSVSTLEMLQILGRQFKREPIFEISERPSFDVDKTWASMNKTYEYVDRSEFLDLETGLREFTGWFSTQFS